MESISSFMPSGLSSGTAAIAALYAGAVAALLVFIWARRVIRGRYFTHIARTWRDLTDCASAASIHRSTAVRDIRCGQPLRWRSARSAECELNGGTPRRDRGARSGKRCAPKRRLRLKQRFVSPPLRRSVIALSGF